MAHKKPHSFDYDLIVIGSGAGGSAAATIAAKSGKSVAIIEADTFGGDSPNWSDVPLSALLHAAHLYDESKNGGNLGLRSMTLSYNLPTMRSWKDLAVKRTGAGGNRKYYESHGISTFSGSAHFLSPNEISVNRRHLSAKHFLIATGSEWAIPDIQGIDKVNVHTPRSIIASLKIPKSILILGGNEIGIEIAQLLTIFGTKVYLAEKSSRILPQYDAEASEAASKFLIERGNVVLNSTEVLSIKKSGLQLQVLMARGGEQKTLRVDEILTATGRAPRVDIGLENARVNYTNTGIIVNDHLQTSAKHIFAAGDVLGQNVSTHLAILQSRVAAHNILHRGRITPDYNAVTEAVFTHPGIARTGITEDEATRRDIVVKVSTAPISIVARSNTSNFNDGFVKIITDTKGVILGATVVAPSASEIIHELTLAVKYGLTAEQVANTPHAFLSWSEAVRVAASKL